MKQILAITSLNYEHKNLILDELKQLSRGIRVPLATILQEELKTTHTTLLENTITFKSFPYITLSIPNYEELRNHVQNFYKSSLLLKKFILLISHGGNYEQLLKSKNEQLLKEHCRSWNTKVHCVFDSYPVFTQVEQQMEKVNKVFMELDIRGKISEADATTKFHLIEIHSRNEFIVFFGLEIESGQRGLEGAYYHVASYKDADKLINDQDLSHIKNIDQNRYRWRRRQNQIESQSKKKPKKNTFKQSKEPSMNNTKVVELKKKNEIKLIVLSQQKCTVETCTI